MSRLHRGGGESHRLDSGTMTHSLLLCTLTLLVSSATGLAHAAGAESQTQPATAAVAPTPVAAEPRTDPEVAAHVESLIRDLRYPARRAEVRTALKEIGRPATPVLLKHAGDADYQVRWEIANAQGDIHDPRAIPQLVEFVLGDENPHVRWRSIWALREYPDHQLALERLLAAHESEAETTRWNAAVGLSMFDDKSCLPTIHAGLGQPDDWRSWEAVNALSRVHDETSLTHLEPFLSTGSERFRREAAVSMGLIGDSKATALLVRLLNDSDPQVRWRAAMSLGRIGDKKTADALRSRRLVETDDFVIEHLVKAIGRLSKRP